jgi:septal ring factor EnvC (AmiA/AmiB activator)
MPSIPTNTQHVIELNKLVGGMQQQIANLMKSDADRSQEVERMREAIAELQQQNATIKQQVGDHDKRIDRWSTRAWGMISLLIGALMSLSAGLIVVLTRKSP